MSTLNTNNNFESDDIKIYPAANRNTSIGRLNIEQNIVNVINRLTDIKSFVVDGLNLTDNRDGTFTLSSGTCNINGYLINIVKDYTLSIDLSRTKILRLSLNYNTVSVDNSYTIHQCTGTDLSDGSKSYYTGLVLDTVSYSSTNDLLPYTSSSAYILPIAKINSPSNTIQKLNDSIRYNINNTFISNLQTSTGLTKTNISEVVSDNTFEDWLKNDFIIDDGEIK